MHLNYESCYACEKFYEAFDTANTETIRDNNKKTHEMY